MDNRRGSLVRTYVDAASARPGFNTSGVAATTLDVNHVRLDRSAGIRLYQQAMERLSALPGVTGVGLTSEPPVGGGSTVTVLPETDSPVSPSGEPVRAAATVVSSRYFQSLGLTIRQGRSFTDNEPAHPRVAIVDETMVRRLWPNASPLGRRFRLAQPDAEPVTVIGVVSNIGEGSSSHPLQPTFYEPFPQAYGARMTIVMRVQGDAGSFFTDIVIVCVVLLATGFAALYLPARWASGLEPADILRSD